MSLIERHIQPNIYRKCDMNEFVSSSISSKKSYIKINKKFEWQSTICDHRFLNHTCWLIPPRAGFGLGIKICSRFTFIGAGWDIETDCSSKRNAFDIILSVILCRLYPHDIRHPNSYLQ